MIPKLKQPFLVQNIMLLIIKPENPFVRIFAYFVCHFAVAHS